jgi:hypothetical protein
MSHTKLSLFVALIFSMLCVQAQAEDVYNFYFQKKSKPAIEKIEEVKKEAVIPEPPFDEPEPLKQNTVQTKVDEVKPVEKDKEWAIRFGIGSMNFGNMYRPFGSGAVYQGQLAQRAYAIGGAYVISRYFEINGELQVPRGESETDISIWWHNNYDTPDLAPQLTIGLGVTPLHLKFFGGDFLAIGVDAGVAIGNPNEISGNSIRSYLGPRLTVNFSEQWSVSYAYRAGIESGDDFNMSSLAVGYTW